MFHRHIGSSAVGSRRLALLVGFTTCALAACAPQGQVGASSDPWSEFVSGVTKAMKNGGGSGLGLPAARANPTLEQVGLKDIMPRYDSRVPLSGQFPHVALTVLHAPANWAGPAMQHDPFTGGFSNIRGCWTLTAVVWSSATTSKKVGPFDWCGPQDVQITPGPMAGMGVLRIQDMSYSTGPNRTVGPRPPETIFPEDRRDFSSGIAPGTKLSQFTGSGLWLMFGNVIYEMGSSLGTSGDYRIWIVTVNG
jgi:hypothetical protein